MSDEVAWFREVSDGATAYEQVVDQDDHGDDEQQVDQATADIADLPDEPQDHEDDQDRPKNVRQSHAHSPCSSPVRSKDELSRNLGM